MLEHLRLRNLGPAAELNFEFGRRINILTGDNGLGKTFVLDLAWWALTRTWAGGRVVHPASLQADEASLSYHVYGVGGPNSPVTFNYLRSDLSWSPLPQRRPPSPGLILYARIDGGFSLWDPERNYFHHGTSDETVRMQRLDSFQFTQSQLWDGKRDDKNNPICRGIIDDLETWRLKRNGEFAMLSEVLNDLSPLGREGPLRIGDPVRLPDSGLRDIPTLVMPYGSVPIPQTSAGIRRILSLAYMIVWAWSEHRVEAELRGHQTTKRIVLLWDEVEAHLHPQWQRSIFPSVITVLQKLLNQVDGTQLQVIATTHAPLVLASLETTFDSESDRLFSLELDTAGKVILEQIPWAKQGDVVEWLQSPAFGMRSGYSREAERALEAAQALMAERTDQLPEELRTRGEIQKELERKLAPEDPFWPRWLVTSGAIG